MTEPSTATPGRLRRSRTPRAAVLASIGVVAVLAAGCNQASPDGPASAPSDRGTPAQGGQQDAVTFARANSAGTSSSCFPDAASPSIINGSFTVRSPVTVNNLKLADPTGLSVVATQVALAPGSFSIGGYTDGEQPPAQVRDRLGWKNRVVAVGAALAPGRYHYFVTVKLTKDGGGDGGIQLSYATADGATHLATARVDEAYGSAC